jgi:hypothetical protein
MPAAKSATARHGVSIAPLSTISAYDPLLPAFDSSESVVVSSYNSKILDFKIRTRGVPVAWVDRTCAQREVGDIRDEGVLCAQPSIADE